MRHPCRLLIAILAATLTTSAFANDVDPKATFFSDIYASQCMKNIYDLDALRAQLQKIPAFPKEQAAPFLHAMEGDAWPVTSPLGNFVIALPKRKNLCAVYARRARQSDVESRFLEMVSTAPPPLVAEKRKDEKNGNTHTISYIWGIPGTPRKIAFILTTSAQEDAELQALATVSIGADTKDAPNMAQP